MILFIEAKPNAKKNQIKVISSNTLKVFINAPPVDGKANAAIIEYLSQEFKIPKSKIKLLKGEASKLKKLEITEKEDILKQFINQHITQI
ncbi:MAG: DUF167 domain-containing protein [Bacteroidia bacterium]